MIANLINTALGLVLVYSAILDPDLFEGKAIRIGLCAAAVFALALWARRSDAYRWQSSADMLLAALLLALALLQFRSPALLTFWGLFWIGILVSVLALWAVMHRPAGARTHPSPSQSSG
ncbi:MAG: hypothetical protein KGJ55_11955 [Gammaproteobacteria bacterium]|nr:hypothetical protein [Gammaproteobacteria bacterium]